MFSDDQTASQVSHLGTGAGEGDFLGRLTLLALTGEAAGAGRAALALRTHFWVFIPNQATVRTITHTTEYVDAIQQNHSHLLGI